MRNKELTPRQREKQERRIARRRKFMERIAENGGDILRSDNFKSTRRSIQHGTISVHSHCISVAGCSLAIHEKLEKMGIKSEEKDIIRGALLHDYFLYDWHHHKHDRGLWNMHGFSHPRTALKNAGREYRLSPREQDIIKKHMWPLTIVPPLCREAWIVTAADKYCSFLETVEPRLKAVKHLGRHWTTLPRRSGGEAKEPNTQENGELAAEEIKAAEK